MFRSVPSLTATVRILTGIVDACYPRNLNERKFMDSWETLEQDALAKSDNSLGTCKFARFLNSLSPEALVHVERAMSNEKISARSLYKALRARGMDCGHTVFHEHMSSTCICYIKKDY